MCLLNTRDELITEDVYKYLDVCRNRFMRRKIGFCLVLLTEAENSFSSLFCNKDEPKYEKLVEYTSGYFPNRRVLIPVTLEEAKKRKVLNIGLKKYTPGFHMLPSIEACVAYALMQKITAYGDFDKIVVAKCVMDGQRSSGLSGGFDIGLMYNLRLLIPSVACSRRTIVEVTKPKILTGYASEILSWCEAHQRGGEYCINYTRT